MTPEEREIIGRFIARVGGASPPLSFPSGGLPAQSTPLPPVDMEADRFIGELFATHPEARYRITQMAFVQEAALAEAQNRIKRLEWDITQAKRAQPAPPAQPRGLFGGLFGGSAPAAPPPVYTPPAYAPPPAASSASYPPGYQQGMFGRGGSGFLGSALTTAAGVAGGVLAADAISSMFAGHSYGGGFGGGFGGGGFGGGEVINETVVNNYGDAASADPWAGAGTTDAAPAADPWSGAGAADAPTADWSDPGTADPGFDSGDQGSSFDDGGGFDSGGSDDSGSF